MYTNVSRHITSRIPWGLGVVMNAHGSQTYYTVHRVQTFDFF